MEKNSHQPNVRRFLQKVSPRGSQQKLCANNQHYSEEYHGWSYVYLTILLLKQPAIKMTQTHTLWQTYTFQLRQMCATFQHLTHQSSGDIGTHLRNFRRCSILQGAMSLSRRSAAATLVLPPQRWLQQGGQVLPRPRWQHWLMRSELCPICPRPEERTEAACAGWAMGKCICCGVKLGWAGAATGTGLSTGLASDSAGWAMAGGRVSAGCAGAGPTGAWGGSSLMSRVIFTQACGAPGGGWRDAHGRAASGVEFAPTGFTGPGVNGVAAAAAGATVAPVLGTGAGVTGVCRFSRVDHVWSIFLWASWTKSNVRWAPSAFWPASLKTKFGCWYWKPASFSNSPAALLFRKISLNLAPDVFTFLLRSEFGSFRKLLRIIATVFKDLVASCLVLLSVTSRCRLAFIASKLSRRESWDDVAGAVEPATL